MKAQMKWLLLLLVSAVMWMGCSEESTGNSCSGDDSCERGTICEDNACETVECVDRADCGANRVCLDDNTCSAAECLSADECSEGQTCIAQVCVDGGSCSVPEDCAATNQICNLVLQECEDPSADATCAQDWQCVHPRTCDTTTGMCVTGPTSCGADTDCSAEQYCDTETAQCATGCRADGCEADGEQCDLTTRQCGPGAVCTASDCAADGGKACDTTTGQCVERSGTGLCGECTAGSNDECGAANVDRCVPLGGGGRCVFSCEAVEDCPSGFKCEAISATNPDAKYCQPLTNACTGCLVDGCTGDQVCNPVSGACEAPKSTCETCVAGLCEAGSDCAEYGGENVCLAFCDEGVCVGTGYTCNATTGLCEPDAGDCSSCNITCGPPNGFVDENTCACVACLVSTDCAGGQACIAGQCQDGNPGGCTDASCQAANPDSLCDLNLGVCYSPGSCMGDAECLSGTCEFGVACSCAGGASCRTGESCLLDFCLVDPFGGILP